MMVAQYSKFMLLRIFGLICLIVAVLALPVQADEDTRAALLAHERLAATVDALEARISVCESKKRVLPDATFKGVDLDNEALRTALSYFSVKADNACIEDAAKEFLLAAALVEAAASQNDKPQRLHGLVTDSWHRELELEIRFNELPEDARDKLSRIDQLKSPFDLLETATEAGLL